MSTKKEIDAVVLDITMVSKRGRLKKDSSRKYEYFKEVMNKIPIDRNHQMIRMYKVMCKLDSIKGYEDVSVLANDIKGLVKTYNDDIANKYEITYTKETPTRTRYYLNFKQTKPVVDVNDIECDDKQATDRNEWCVNWVINEILGKFNMFGFGSQIKAKDLIGKVHPFCERTKFYIMNTHVAEARRVINSNPDKYGFCLSSKYTIYPTGTEIE